MAENRWSQEELQAIRALDLDLARLESEYLGGTWHQDTLFVPSEDGIGQIKAAISRKQADINRLSDPFWRHHFTAVLESLLFQVEVNSKLPYEFITRVSSGFDGLSVKGGSRTPAERAQLLVGRLSKLPEMLASIKELLVKGGDLGRTQMVDMLPPLFGNVDRAVAFVKEHAHSEAAKAQAEKDGLLSKAKAQEIMDMVEALDLRSLESVDIPFEFSLEKGMQVPLDYVLSWYQDDVEMRKEEFFRVAKEIDPNRDAYDLMNNGSPGYDTVEAMFQDMRNILDHTRESARRFVDIPENESCGVGVTPETWRKVCPTAMYTGDAVCLNPDNLGAFRRGSLEETAAHEVYPGHHVHRVKTSLLALPHTFNLNLFMSRCHGEGICHRSEFLMMPYYQDPIARLEAARRGWYCSTRVKAEVDIYYNRRPVAEVIDNYIKSLNCTTYSAEGQTRAHLMRPADAVSYYTGMRFLESMYQESGMDQKEFTDETFNYGNITLQTMKDIFGLSPEKKEQLKRFDPAE